VDEAGLHANGWDVVRRPTGGRAILHVDELTYAVIAPLEHPLLRGDILASYQRLSRGLLAALENLSVPAAGEAHYPRPADTQPTDSICFEIPAHWEITANGKKLVGSAQVRRRNAVLQHGTLPLHGDLRRITRALAFESEPARAAAAARLLERSTTVEGVLGRLVSWDEAADAFAAGFARALGLNLNPGELSPAEAARAAELVGEKYGDRGWVRRRA
jgi:lipoate-protein ligase A